MQLMGEMNYHQSLRHFNNSAVLLVLLKLRPNANMSIDMRNIKVI